MCMAKRTYFLLPILFLSLAACSVSQKKADKPIVDKMGVEELYKYSKTQIQNYKFSRASDALERIETEFPHSYLAMHASVLKAYAYYSDGRYDDAIIVLNRYIRENRGAQDIGYAYYLKALCYYDQVNDVRKDQGVTLDAMAALQDVVDMFPNSEYAQDARLKIDLAENYLAGKEMDVGRFYLKRRHFGAAVNRFQKVIRDYQSTIHTEEALHRLTEAYLSLGLLEEAQATASVLGYNFPGSDWYQDTYKALQQVGLAPKKSDTSWIVKIWKKQ